MSDQLDSASNDSYHEDWDNSLVSEGDYSPESSDNASQPLTHGASTPRNSVIFPVAEEGSDATPSRNVAERSRYASGQGKRTLSELLRLHAEKGTDCRLSPEEAARLGDVLGQWVGDMQLFFAKGYSMFLSRSMLPRHLMKGKMTFSNPMMTLIFRQNVDSIMEVARGVRVNAQAHGRLVQQALRHELTLTGLELCSAFVLL